MKKLKELMRKLLNDLKEADWKSPGVILASVLFLSAPVIVGLAAYHAGKKQPNDIRNSAVMITNRKGNSGGTGIILTSSRNDSVILTNAHVCGVVKKGGLVNTKFSSFNVTSIVESKLSDLCLIRVLADLGVNTELAEKEPQFYDKAIVSGHPGLMPNVITEGHYSGRKNIQVLTGVKNCTDKDLEDPEMGLICGFFSGRVPVVKNYESVLVTATIMPGSSGSGVYNQKFELTSVVFAGSGELGYAWTVPYEQVRNFLESEHASLNETVISQEVSMLDAVEDNNKNLKEIIAKCSIATEPVVKKFCESIVRDAIVR